jgi:hypothetical protein
MKIDPFVELLDVVGRPNGVDFVFDLADTRFDFSAEF